jgi:hypothetical protein
MLGMANRRDGGYVILGVEGDPPEPVGLNETQVDSWAKYDDVAAAVNEYASPSVSFELDPPKDYRGQMLVVITVHEFSDIPVLCRRDVQAPSKRTEPPILRRGACYVRSRRKPETSEIPSEEEMRELLELAIDKGVRKFVARVQAAGLLPPLKAATLSRDDEALFAKEVEDLESEDHE